MKIKITGRRYNETPYYYGWDKSKKYANYKLTTKETWEIEADSLSDGEKWLANNHPDMYMGGSVACENGDFACFAVPSFEYGNGYYETIQNRIAWVKSYLNVEGILLKGNEDDEI